MSENESSPRTAVSVSAFAPLRHKVFLSLWIASIVSSIGTQMQQVGASWLMTSLDPSPEMIALVTASATMPILLFALAAGAMADIIGRRKVLIAANILMFAASCLLAIAAYAGKVTPNLLLLLTFLVGTGTAIMAPSWQSLVNDLLPREQVPRGVALNVMAFNIARTVGPAIAGVVVALLGSKANFALNAISYLGMFAVLARWKPEQPKGKIAAVSVLTAMHDGVLYAFHTTPVRRVLVRASFFTFCSSIVIALVALVVKKLLGEGPEIFGLLLGFMGIGAIMMALQIGQLRDRFSVETLVRASIVMGAAGLAVMGLSRSLPLTCGAIFLIGASQVLGLSNFNVAVQVSVPHWVTARAIALYQTAIFGGFTLGAWCWGLIAEQTGVGPTYVISAIAMLAMIGLGFCMPIREIDADLTEPAPITSAWVMPEGPDKAAVVVLIDYFVPLERQQQFRELMSERQRLRLRDGSRQVRLLQDAEAPEHFIEMFKVRSREDYMLQRERRTVEAERLYALMKQCHAGDEPPRVRYYFENVARPGGADAFAQYPLG